MVECIFCKIVEGEAPAFKVFEDSVVEVFLDKDSASYGHLLVIPRKHYENILDTPEDITQHISLICKKMAHLLIEKLGATGVNILNASGKSAEQRVFHLHFHVVPRFDNDGLNLWFHGNPTRTESLEEVYRKLI